MAQLNKKNMYIFVTCFVVLIVLLFLLPTSKVIPADSNNLVSLNEDDFKTTIRLRPGPYNIYIKTPFNVEAQNIKIGLFSSKKISVNQNEIEAGIDQVAQKSMARAGHPDVDINGCTKIGSYHYVCETYQLSATVAAELIFENHGWQLNLDPEKAANAAAKEQFTIINARNKHQ